MVKDIRYEPTIHIRLVGFDDDEGNVFEFVLHVDLGLLGAIGGADDWYTAFSEFAGVDAAEANALVDPNFKPKIDADEQRVAVDHVLQGGLVDVEGTGITLERAGGGRRRGWPPSWRTEVGSRRRAGTEPKRRPGATVANWGRKRRDGLQGWRGFCLGVSRLSESSSVCAQKF